jgi:hypothetical protein
MTEVVVVTEICLHDNFRYPVAVFYEEEDAQVYIEDRHKQYPCQFRYIMTILRVQ